MSEASKALSFDDVSIPSFGSPGSVASRASAGRSPPGQAPAINIIEEEDEGGDDEYEDEEMEDRDETLGSKNTETESDTSYSRSSASRSEYTGTSGSVASRQSDLIQTRLQGNPYAELLGAAADPNARTSVSASSRMSSGPIRQRGPGSGYPRSRSSRTRTPYGSDRSSAASSSVIRRQAVPSTDSSRIKRVYQKTAHSSNRLAETYVPHKISVYDYPIISDYLNRHNLTCIDEYEVMSYEALIAFSLLANTSCSNSYELLNSNNYDVIANGTKFVDLRTFISAVSTLLLDRNNRVIAPGANMYPPTPPVNQPMVMAFKMRYLPVVPKGQEDRYKQWLGEQGLFGGTYGFPLNERGTNFMTKTVEFFKTVPQFNDPKSSGNLVIPPYVAAEMAKSKSENKVIIYTSSVVGPVERAAPIVDRRLVQAQMPMEVFYLGLFDDASRRTKLVGRPLAVGGFGRIYTYPGRPDVIVKVPKRSKPMSDQDGEKPIPRSRAAVFLDSIEETAILSSINSEYIMNLIISNIYSDADGTKGGVLTMMPRGICNLVMLNIKMGSSSAHVPLVELHTLRGLEYLHSRDIIHRDLKISNILVYGDPMLGRFTFKITDFGTAIRGSVYAKFRGHMPGMAPESYQLGEYNTASDMYMWAVMIFQCYSGYHPFEPNFAQIDQGHGIFKRTMEQLGMYRTDQVLGFVRNDVPEYYVEPPSAADLLKYFNRTTLLSRLPVNCINTILPIFTIYPQLRPTPSQLLSTPRYKNIALYANAVPTYSEPAMDPRPLSGLVKHGKSIIKNNVVPEEFPDFETTVDSAGKTKFGLEMMTESVFNLKPSELYSGIPADEGESDAYAEMVKLRTPQVFPLDKTTRIKYERLPKRDKDKKPPVVYSDSSDLSDTEITDYDDDDDGAVREETAMEKDDVQPQQIPPVPTDPLADMDQDEIPAISSDVTFFTDMNLDNIKMVSTRDTTAADLFKFHAQMTHVKIHNRMQVEQGSKAKYICTLMTPAVPNDLVVKLAEECIRLSANFPNTVISPYQSKVRSYRNSEAAGHLYVINQSGGCMGQYLKVGIQQGTFKSEHYLQIFNGLLLMIREMITNNIIPSNNLTFDDVWWDSQTRMVMFDHYAYVTRIVNKASTVNATITGNTFFLTEKSLQVWFGDLLTYTAAGLPPAAKIDLTNAIKNWNRDLISTLFINKLLTSHSGFNQVRPIPIRHPITTPVSLRSESVASNSWLDNASNISAMSDTDNDTGYGDESRHLFDGVYSDISQVHMATAMCRKSVAAAFGSETKANITIINTLGRSSSGRPYCQYKVNPTIIGGGTNALDQLAQTSDVTEVKGILAPESITNVNDTKWIIMIQATKECEITGLFRQKKTIVKMMAFIALVDPESTMRTVDEFFTPMSIVMV